MKYSYPAPKAEWKIKPEVVAQIDEGFAMLNRCAAKRASLDLNDPKQVEEYQFEAQFAYDRASDARARENLVTFTDPIQKELDRFFKEDYMPIESLMALSSDLKEIKVLEKFFSTVNSHVKRKNYDPKLRANDYRIVLERCLEYDKRADELPVQARNIVYFMLAKIYCNMKDGSTTIDSGKAPRDLFDPEKGHEYAAKIKRADGSKPYLQERIEKQMGLNADGTLKLSAAQIKAKKRTKRLIIIGLVVVAVIVAIMAAVAVMWIAFVVFAFYVVFKMMVSDATDRTPSVGPRFGPNSNYSGGECGKCSLFEKASCPRYSSGHSHPHDPACDMMNNPSW